MPELGDVDAILPEPRRPQAERVVAAMRPEPWEAGRVARLAAPKEGLVREVDPAERRSLDLDGDGGERGIGHAQLCELRGLIEPRHGPSGLLPVDDPLFQRSVVERAALMPPIVEDTLLGSVRVKSVPKGSSHAHRSTARWYDID